MFSFLLQMDRGHVRKDALIPNIRSENLRENSFSVCTLTRRNVCSSLECSTSPIDKWRFGFRTAAWRRRNWTETGYSITPPILYFRSQMQLSQLQSSAVGLTGFTDWLTGCVFPMATQQWPQQQQLLCSTVNFKFEDNCISLFESFQDWNDFIFAHQTLFENIEVEFVLTKAIRLYRPVLILWRTVALFIFFSRRQHYQSIIDWHSVFCNQKTFFSFLLRIRKVVTWWVHDCEYVTLIIETKDFGVTKW